MHFKSDFSWSLRSLILLLAATLVISLGTLSFGQDDTEEEETVAADPVSLGLQVARDVIEEELSSPLRVVRWFFYEDNWSSVASWNLYGSFGIDNCVDELPILLKRSDVLFGWTFTFRESSGKEYQARVSYDLEETAICDEVHVPPQYASVASAQSAQPAAAEGPANTGPVGFALGGHVLHLDSETAALMRGAGMTWIKKQVRFEDGIGAALGVINNAKAHGFKIMLGVVGSKGSLVANFDSYIAGFADFLGQLARNGADAIEVWNEPNIKREWPSGQINGAHYTRMLKAAYEAIKAANSGTWVISGAPAPTGYFAGGCQDDGCNDDVFMQQMAAAGAAQYMDCLGLHYNEGVVSPRQNSGDPRGSYPSRFFNSMLFRGAQSFPNSKICWSELGYLSAEGMNAPIPTEFDWTPNDPITVAEQAEWLADAARLSRDSGRVSLMIVWNVNFSAWGSDPQAGYAIVRPGGACPACASLGAAMSG